jgi:hypothetical protein
MIQSRRRLYVQPVVTAPRNMESIRTLAGGRILTQDYGEMGS